MSFSGEKGAEIDLSKVPLGESIERNDFILFSESNSRFIVEVKPQYQERFEKFLVACEADARGRSGFENKDYPQADYFRRALELASKINIDALIEKGFEGEALGQEIKKQRIRILKENLQVE